MWCASPQFAQMTYWPPFLQTEFFINAPKWIFLVRMEMIYLLLFCLFLNRIEGICLEGFHFNLEKWAWKFFCFKFFSIERKCFGRYFWELYLCLRDSLKLEHLRFFAILILNSLMSNLAWCKKEFPEKNILFILQGRYHLGRNDAV